MACIFLDESGQFSKHNHEEYFVIGSFTIGDPRRTAKAFRGWCRTRFPRRMRTQSEIKWSATGIKNDIRLRTLKYISRLDVRIRYAYILKKNILEREASQDQMDDIQKHSPDRGRHPSQSW